MPTRTLDSAIMSHTLDASEQASDGESSHELSSGCETRSVATVLQTTLLGSLGLVTSLGYCIVDCFTAWSYDNCCIHGRLCNLWNNTTYELPLVILGSFMMSTPKI